MHEFLLKGLLNEPSAIQRFSKEYIVKDHLVKNYVCHLENLKFKKNKREESRKRLQKEERSKTYNDYSWTLMYREGQLRKLKVSSLDLYLEKHCISCSRSTLKQDRVDIVAAHIARTIVNDAMNNGEDDVEDEESDEEYIDDVVLEEIGDDSDEDETTDSAQQSETEEDASEGDGENEDNDNSSYDYDNDDDDDNDNDDSEEVQVSDVLCTTKSGRTCRTWKGRYLYY